MKSGIVLLATALLCGCAPHAQTHDDNKALALKADAADKDREKAVAIARVESGRDAQRITARLKGEKPEKLRLMSHSAIIASGSNAGGIIMPGVDDLGQKGK